MRSGLLGVGGTAVVTALAAMMLMLVLGTALSLLTTTETRITANNRDGVEALYAADAAVALAVGELRSVADWSEALTGAATSTRADGPPSGSRTLADGEAISLDGERPVDGSGVAWRLYTYGVLATWLPKPSVDPRIYVAVWVGGDREGREGALVLLGRAYGARGARRAVEVTIRRIAGPGAGAHGPTIERLSWRER